MKGNSSLLEKGVANVANLAKGNGNVGRYCINFSLNNCSSRESFVNWSSNKKQKHIIYYLNESEYVIYNSEVDCYLQIQIYFFTYYLSVVEQIYFDTNVTFQSERL